MHSVEDDLKEKQTFDFTLYNFDVGSLTRLFYDFVRTQGSHPAAIHPSLDASAFYGRSTNLFHGLLLGGSLSLAAPHQNPSPPFNTMMSINFHYIVCKLRNTMMSYLNCKLYLFGGFSMKMDDVL